MEHWPDVASTARANLVRHGVTNVEIVAGNGAEELPEHAPYEVTLVSAASPQVPLSLIEQIVSSR